MKNIVYRQQASKTLLGKVLLFFIVFIFLMGVVGLYFNLMSPVDVILLLVTETILIFAYLLRLDVEVCEKLISYKISFLKKNTIQVQNLADIKIEKISVVPALGGWGIRRNGKVTGIILQGDSVLKLYKKNGTQLWLGFPVELEEELRNTIF